MIIIKISKIKNIPAIIPAKQYGRFLAQSLILLQEQHEHEKMLQSQQLQLQLHTFSEKHFFILENNGHVHLYCFFGGFLAKTLFLKL